MSGTAITGVKAFAVVGSLFLGGGWAVYSHFHGSSHVRGVIVLADEEEQPGESVLMGKVCSHPFWRVKVTPTMVEKLLTDVRRLQKYAVWAVDEHFNRDGTDPFDSARCFSISMDRYESRPSREKLLCDIVKALDAADYSSEPSR